MNTKIKRTGAMIAVAAYVTSVVAGLGLVFGGKKTVSAATTENEKNYFYTGLKYNPKAERFYNAFEDIAQSGALKLNDVEYELVNSGVAIASDVMEYVEAGSATLPVAFSAGRDAFYMDNVDLFYVDLFGLSISAGTMAGEYVAYIDNSRTASLYVGDIDSEVKIDKAIEDYEAAIKTITDGAKTAGDVKAQIEYVNEYIATHTEYSFCTELVDGKLESLPEAAYISTSYGALVNNKATCGGYAKAFKAVLDRLEIPCVCIQGYALSTEGSYQPHMWNAVKLEGQWYAVDVTWNSTTGNTDKYLFLGSVEISKDHIEDDVVSSSGYELKYPALKPYNYGSDKDENGMDIKGDYTDTESSGRLLTLDIVYDGKGALELQNEGKYLVVRFGDKGENGGVEWLTDWMSYVYCADFIFPSSFEYSSNKSTLHLHAGIPFIQCALVDYAPDKTDGGRYPENNSSYPDYYTQEMIDELRGTLCYYLYEEENLTENHFITTPSAPYENEGVGTYIPAPNANTVTPNNSGRMNVNETINVTIVYDEKLELAEGKTADDVYLDVTSFRGNDTIKDSVTVANFEWDGDRTITFTFTPSKMYIHNATAIYMVPANLVGTTSKKIPNPVTYYFEGKTVVCSRVFNDGRLYMLLYGEPQIVDTSDLSVTDFKDENGNYYAAEQRSQLMLVAEHTGNAKTAEMDEVLLDETPLVEDDIVTKETYEIDLSLCGCVQKVPNGSYMQVAFGFPEGYSPDDAGTTFKIYHYKHDDEGNIIGVEEIPAIITQYGIIARVTSFSPFTIVQVKNTSAAVTESTTKSIYSSVTGNGGTICTTDGMSGIQQVTGDSITYNITAESGYKVDRVLLNGKALDASKYADGTLTLTKAELEDGNTLEVSFVTQKAAASYEAKGVEIKQPETIVLTSADISGSFIGSDPAPAKPGVSDNAKAIIITAVVCVAVVGAATATGLIIAKKRKDVDAK